MCPKHIHTHSLPQPVTRCLPQWQILVWHTRNNKKIFYVIYLIHTFQTLYLSLSLFSFINSCLTILWDYQWHCYIASFPFLWCLFLLLSLTFFHIQVDRLFIVPSHKYHLSLTEIKLFFENEGDEKEKKRKRGEWM